MRAQEKVVKITETVIAVRAGTKYHRTGCGHLRNHTVAAGTAKDFSPCWDCFPEKVLVTDREYRNVKCYGLAACVVLLVGFSLGSLATLCRLMMSPGTHNVEVTPWQALGPWLQQQQQQQQQEGQGRTCLWRWSNLQGCEPWENKGKETRRERRERTDGRVDEQAKKSPIRATSTESSTSGTTTCAPRTPTTPT